MEIRNARIASALIGFDEHNELGVTLKLGYCGGGLSFGGSGLYVHDGHKHHSKWGLAGHFIYRCLEIAGAYDWTEIPGKTIRIKIDGGGIYSIGHIIDEDWFTPSEDFKGLEFAQMTAKPQAENPAESWQAIAEELAAQCERQHRQIGHMLSKAPGYFCSKDFKPSKESIEEWIKFAKQSIKDKEE